MDEVYFVSQPIEWRLEGGVFRADIQSGDRIIHLALPANICLASFAGLAVVAREWRGGGAEIVELDAIRG